MNSEVMMEAGIKPEMLLGMGPLARPFERFVKDCAAIVVNENAMDPVMAVVNTAPMTPARPKLQVIVPDALARYFDGLLANLTYLNLHSNNIRQLENLSVCTNLQTLVCSFNEIHKIEGLEGLKSLERLELGFNFIKRLDGLQGLGNLKVLELNNNLIYRLEDLSLLKKHNPHITDLNLSNNAVSDVKSYRSLVLNKLESLQVLDGKSLTQVERVSAANHACTMTSELLFQCSHFVRRSQWRHVNKSPERTPAENQTSDEISLQSDDWMANVEELDMDHRRLRKIAPLNKMTKLRRATFCDNELTRIEGLESCLSLEELFLEENKLTKIERLSTLTNLRKLDLGRNKISKADGLESLHMLAELSLEDNELEELSSLAGLHSLMELYLCNNKVANLNELLWLKELPKLIILDMFGNPCFNDPEYRLHTIFYLKKLKVLDGVPVDMQELHDARDKYAGRITEEWIEEHLGHRDFGQVTELQLPGAFIREAQILFSGKFESLHQLNLDNNLIWDLSTFANMPQLATLRLNNNRVGQGPTKGSKDAVAAEELLMRSGFTPDCLSSLEVLYLEGNHISIMGRLGLGNLKGLRSLYLGNNDIVKIEGLNALQHLRELNLNKNKIKSVDDEAFTGLASLRELSLEENGLKSLTNFQYLPFLHTLHLTANRIQDFAEIDKLVSTRTLLDISIQNNPLARKAFYRVSIIKRLQSLQMIDGKPITWEERERADTTNGDYRTQTMYPSIVQDTRPRNNSSGHRVPVKVTSVTFECIGGVRTEDPMMLASKNGGPPGVEMPLNREQQQAVMAARAEESANERSRDEFFLPNVGQKLDFPRRRASSESRLQEVNKLARPQSTMAPADKPPRNPSSALNGFKNVTKQSRLTINAGSSSRLRSTPRTKTNISR